MKNILRISLLIALLIVASKVLFSDFDLTESKNNAVTIVTTK